MVIGLKRWGKGFGNEAEKNIQRLKNRLNAKNQPVATSEQLLVILTECVIIRCNFFGCALGITGWSQNMRALMFKNRKTGGCADGYENAQWLKIFFFRD